LELDAVKIKQEDYHRDSYSSGFSSYVEGTARRVNKLKEEV